MFSALRRRIHVSPATAIASLALVFAMIGGAYAAKKYLITSTKQISPSVLKSLQGKAGPAGANGAPGAQGAQGPAGTAGPQGSAGVAGAKGDTGAPGAPGVKGEKGATGEKGTTGFTETLPSGKTETGVWDVRTGAALSLASAPVSFTLPVEQPAPTPVYVGGGEDKSAQGCPGIVSGLPLAEPGKLCIYAGVEVGIEEGAEPLFYTTTEEEVEPGVKHKFFSPGVGPAGTVLRFNCTGPCVLGGAWAVTGQ